MVRPISMTSDIAATDVAARFPSKSELEAVSNSLKKAQVRLNAAEVFALNAEELSANAVNFVVRKFPDAAKTSQFLFNSPPEIESHSLKEDVDVLLRLLTYCLVIGHDNPLESTSLETIFNQISCAIRESSEISASWYIEALEFLRKNHGLSGESAEEVSSYINYIVDAFR